MWGCHCGRRSPGLEKKFTAAANSKILLSLTSTEIMSRAPPPSQKKRKLDDAMRGKVARPKKSKRPRVKDYHSSSDESEYEQDGFAPVNLADSDDERPAIKAKSQSKVKAKERKPKPPPPTRQDPEDSGPGDQSSGGSSEGDNNDGEGPTSKVKHKRNDPEVFSTSISKILSTKLSQSARKDPVLSRSKQAAETSSSLANDKLERKAKAKLRAEKKDELDRGRNKDVLGIETGTTGEVAAEEKRLRKIAQRGVVALFNAFRAAQVRGEQAAKEEQKKGTVGISNRDEKVTQMSKQGFMELINGQKKSKS